MQSQPLSGNANGPGAFCRHPYGLVMFSLFNVFNLFPICPPYHSLVRAGTDGRAALRGEGRIAGLCRRVLAWAGRPLLSPAEAAEGGLSLLVITDAAPILDLSCVAVGGRVLLKGRPARPVPLELRAVVEREITLQGVNYGDFDLAVRLLHSGAVPVDDLFAPPLPLADFAAVFSGAEDRKAFLSMGA